MEVLVVISLGAVLSGIAVAALGSLFRHDREATRHVAQRGEMQRLAATLRQDIHRATDCQWNAERQRLRLQFLERQQVVYERLEERWVRVANGADDNGAEANAVRTAYGLNQQFACTCAPAAATEGDLVRVRFGSQAGGRVAAAEPREEGGGARQRLALSCEVVAVVGRDRQMLHAAGLKP
jgi:type II secretory pathway component PulJ